MQKYGMGILGQTTGWVRCPEEDLGKQCPCQWDTGIDRLVDDKGFFTIFLNPREPTLKVPSAAGCTWRERVHRQPPHRQECQRKRHRCGAWACTTSTTSCCPGWARSRVRTHARPCSCANGCTGTSTSPCQDFGIVVMVALVPFTEQLGMPKYAEVCLPKCHSCDLPQLLLPITNIRKLGICWINYRGVIQKMDARHQLLQKLVESCKSFSKVAFGITSLALQRTLQLLWPRSRIWMKLSLHQLQSESPRKMPPSHQLQCWTPPSLSLKLREAEKLCGLIKHTNRSGSPIHASGQIGLQMIIRFIKLT